MSLETAGRLIATLPADQSLEGTICNARTPSRMRRPAQDDPRSEYRAAGYEPPFEMLPTLDEFEAAEEAEDGDE